MCEPRARWKRLGVGAVLWVTVVAMPCSGEVSKNLLANGSFGGGVNDRGLPVGWSLYGGDGQDQQIKVIDLADGGGKAVLLVDGDPGAEIGLNQAIAVKPGETYEASVEVRTVEGASAHGAHLQLRFTPSGRYVQRSFTSRDAETFKRVSAKLTAPAGSKRATVYLYTHRTPTPKVVLRNASLVSGVPPPPPPPPEPVPPQYETLKALHLETGIVVDGKPNATIVVPASGVYGKLAERIRGAVQHLTGAMLPVVDDASPAAAVPIGGHVIVLGNRSTNRTIGKLYDLYYTLLDLRYPGAGGSVVRTLHNPFGDGRNVVFVGGSDATGVDAAANVLVDLLGKAGAKPGSLTIGRLAAIKLGKGIVVPTDIREFKTWEASKGYRSVGYFGWCSLSKRLAMHYMTGEPVHAREFIRLAFPDDKAKADIAEIDGERIENKDDPLAGPYHYNAHMMILFWDLVEESPAFTDAERLRVTNAFARQLDHRKNEGIYRLTHPPAHVGSRHGQWSAISLYCLGRYFQKDYPNPIWAQCMRGARYHFMPLHEHAWVSGENDNLFWYNTAIAPIFTYLALTGDRKPLANGVVPGLLRNQEILVSGRQPDWALGSASMGFLHKAAYLTGDGRWLAYRDRTGVDVETFRLGQSFWPGPELTPKQPDDLVGKWSVNPLPEPMWMARNTGFEEDESFQFASYRSTTDASGDYILIDGLNGASRNPYHTFAILELRLGGHTLLKGYRNQLITRADGLVEPRIAMNAALKDYGVIGSTAYAVAEVPDAAYCNWRRTLIQRIGKFAVVIDELTPRTDSENMQVELLWETENTPKTFPDGHVEFQARTETPEPRNVSGGQIHCCDVVRPIKRGKVVTLEWVGPVRKDRQRVFYTLIGLQPGAEKASMGCYRSGDRLAALALPEPALVGAVGSDKIILASEDHYFARGVNDVILFIPRRIERGKIASIFSGQPIDVDWDLVGGELHIVAKKPTRLELALADRGAVRLNGKPVPTEQLQTRMALPAGKHVFTNARPDLLASVKATKGFLAQALAQAREMRAHRRSDKKATRAAGLPAPKKVLSARVGGKVVDLLAVPAQTDDGSDLIYAAEGKTVHVMTADGKEAWTLSADGPIRMLRWWAEHKLLLVGCADEKVIAFDAAGKRKWVFVSEMDPAVFRAAKTYWFKSHPGLEGIHGLYTGVFLDGKSQAFVGSACTLEILDEQGKLIKRMPQFWGTPSHFAIVNGPGGSLNLLASRRWNGTNQVRVINNRKLDPGWRGFHSVPSGATYVGGWSSMNRYHLFYEDLDGDGAKEVVSEINGTWNRVTVWTQEGKALCDASFGPGERIQQNTPVKNMRDLEVFDINGDGKKEILAATSSGLIVCLGHQCKKVWARRLDSPPTVIKCVTIQVDVTALRSDIAPGSTSRAFTKRVLVVAGCENGSVVVLNGQGEVVRIDKVKGTPIKTETLDTPDGPLVVFGTAKGQVEGFVLRSERQPPEKAKASATNSRGGS